MNLQIHHYFALIALVFGLLVLWLTPPFQSPDETNHFHRSAHLTTGYLMGQILNGNRLGGRIDESLLTYSMHFDSIRKSDDSTIEEDDYNWSRKLDQTGPVFVDFANVGYYSPTVYLPHMVGFSLCQLMHLTPHQSLYLTRLFGLLSWIMVMSLAISIIPIQKILICFLALLPSSISLASCVSGDPFTSSLCFLWVALLLRVILTEHKINFKEFTLLCIIIGLITLNKLVYFPLVFLIFAVPNDRLQRAILMKSTLLGLTIGLLLIWIPYSKSLFIPYSEYSPIFRDGQQLNPPVNPDAQLAWIFSHPLSFIQVTFSSYIESAHSTVAHYLGKFGWEKNYLHPFIIGLLGFFVGFLSLNQAQQSPSLSKTFRITLIGVGLMMIAGLSVSLYLQWSPVGGDRIRSLSGRYFIPILPLFLLALSCLKIDNQRRIHLFSFLLSGIGLIFLILAISTRW